MPGFIDVTGWTSEEVRRLGHADDCDDVDFRPRRKVAPTRPASVKYTVSDVWAAACAADRINGGYVKEYVYEWDEATQTNKVVKDKNRHIMMHFLADPTRLTVDDIERGEHCRQFLQNDLTFRTLKGKIVEFDTAVKKVLAVTEHFDSYQHKYELAIVACLPASVARSEQRQKTDERVTFAQGGLIEPLNQKITVNVEVLSAVFSQKFGIYWIRAVTDADQPVLFSYKEKFDEGTHITIRGTVNAHKENLTQLKRVKVL